MPAMSSSPSFHGFPDLAPELRIAIWDDAIASHLQDALENLPPHLRRRLDGKTHFWDDSGHQDLVECFPILAACHEARRRAIDYFRQRAGPRRRLLYFPPHLWRLERWRDGAVPIQMSLGHDSDGASSSQPPPTTLCLSQGRFASPRQLVGVAARHFGTEIERVVFHFDVGPGSGTALNSSTYWPNPKCAAGMDVDDLSAPYKIVDNHKHIISLNIARHGPPEAMEVMSVSRDREIRRSTKARSHRCYKLAMHLLILMDLVDAARRDLPRLKHFEVHCEDISPPLERDIPFDPDKHIEWTRIEAVVGGNGQLFGWFTEFRDHFY
ncbi:hypothetical protein MAPG_07285 [Magnaporthiopsis poae ATCC 64411]|uniref:2EXR domain-containing protein n=1 Tax=Magnaporthiopsis poae (strain ATCC 64411 / 73-15) TaxID=644358 RepID=A0A0C4E494_MAGP6|nr:hypothetical protein MAPG_07285 [Magnaporthiopsis poae ATCC 64411]